MAKTKHRSPAYPAVNLQQAIEHAQTIYDADRRNQVPVAVAISHLGFPDGSSQGLRAVAALKQFGLLEEDGKNEDRRVRLTERALDILIAPSTDDPGRFRAIQRAALEPTVHAELWEQYNGELPSDATIRAQLVRHREFNETYVDRFIKEFRDTIAFARLSESDTIGDEESEIEDDTPQEIKAGDFVQWSSRGVDQFPTPRKVVAVEGEWAFVEGSPTGVPMSELLAADPPAGTAPKQPPTNPHYKPSEEPPIEGVSLDRAALDEGPVVLRWPDELSAESVEEFEYWVNGLIKRARRKAGITAKRPKSE